MDQEAVGHDFALGTQGVDGAGQIGRVPQGDGGEHDIETAGAVLVRLPAPVLQLAAAMEEDGSGKAVTCLALVQLIVGAAAQIGALQPVQGEKGAFQAPEVVQCHCQTVLAWIGRKSAQHQRRRHCPGTDRGCQTQDVVPASTNPAGVELAGEQRLKVWIGGWWTRAVQAAIFQATDTRCEMKAQEMHQREDMLAHATGICMMGGRREIALVIQ